MVVDLQVDLQVGHPVALLVEQQVICQQIMLIATEPVKWDLLVHASEPQVPLHKLQVVDLQLAQEFQLCAGRHHSQIQTNQSPLKRREKGGSEISCRRLNVYFNFSCIYMSCVK